MAVRCAAAVLLLSLVLWYATSPEVFDTVAAQVIADFRSSWDRILARMRSE